MDIQYLQDEWTKDAVIDRARLDEHLLQIPALHGKYLSFMLAERHELKSLEREKATLKIKLRHYYLGVMSAAALKAMERKPLSIKIDKPQIMQYIEADKLWHDLMDNVSLQEEKVKMLEGYVNSLNRRGFDIKSAIEYMKFKNGVV